MHRITLEAREGMVYTDGEIFGDIIYLGEGRSVEEFYEITKEEAEQRMGEMSDGNNVHS